MTTNPLPVHDPLKSTLGTTSTTRPRHQVARSITEISSFPKLHRQHHSIHPHHHHTSRHKDHEGASQSAGPNLQLNGENVGSVSDSATQNENSRDASRRTSDLGVRWEDGENRVVREGQVAEEKERGAQRASEVRNAILDLNSLSNNTTRRLDNTYYSVLEKLSVLQNAISSMKELAIMTKHLNEEFSMDSEEIVRDTRAQLETFEGFEKQERTIAKLQERVHIGRGKVEVLGGRVDIVRRRVEGWEKAEFAWQEKTRKRLRAMWVVMAACAMVFLALVAFQYTPSRSPGTTGGINNTNNSSLRREVPDFAWVGNETLDLQKKRSGVLEGLRNREGNGLEDDPRLRIFDEL